MIWVFLKDRTTMLPKKFKDAKLDFDRVIVKNINRLFKFWPYCSRLLKEQFRRFLDH